MSKLDPRIEEIRARYGLMEGDFWQIPQNKQWVGRRDDCSLPADARRRDVQLPKWRLRGCEGYYLGDRPYQRSPRRTSGEGGMTRALALTERQVKALCEGSRKAGYAPIIQIGNVLVRLVPEEHAIPSQPRGLTDEPRRPEEFQTIEEYIAWRDRSRAGAD